MLQKAEEVMQRLGYAAFLRGEDARTTACRDIAGSLRRVREDEAKRLRSVEVSNDPASGLTYGPR